MNEPTKKLQPGDDVDVSKHIYLCLGCGKTIDDRAGSHPCVPHTARTAFTEGPPFAQSGRLTIGQAMTRHLRVMAEAREQVAYWCWECKAVHTDVYDGDIRDWREPIECMAGEALEGD